MMILFYILVGHLYVHVYKKVLHLNLIGSAPAPSYVVHVKRFNTLTTATIVWESGGNGISYTIRGTNTGTPFSGIIQTSFILHDLEVETDYVVSVTATNECGDESPPSEEIITRIDTQGAMYICKYENTSFHISHKC